MKLKISDLKRLIAEEIIRLNEGDIYIVRRGNKLFTIQGDIETYYGPATEADELDDGEVTAIPGGLSKDAKSYTNIAGASPELKRKRLFSDY